LSEASNKPSKKHVFTYVIAIKCYFVSKNMTELMDDQTGNKSTSLWAMEM